MASEVCYWCNKYSLELRAYGTEGMTSCAICRTNDRIRTLCNRMPTESGASVLNFLKDTEVRLRDWVSFGKPPGPDGVYERQTSGLPNESLASALRIGGSLASSSTGPQDRATPSRSGQSQALAEPSREPLPRHKSRAGTAPGKRAAEGSRWAAVREHSPKRKKKNKGIARKQWQQARVDLAISRAHASIDFAAEHFSEPEESDTLE